MKEQTHGNGFALSEMLYGQRELSCKIEKPALTNNPLDSPPSIIPGVPYPISDREKEIVNLTWLHCRKIRGGL
ncbi:MAG: hypothetical protein WD267_01220 [Balneolales bacterium]